MTNSIFSDTLGYISLVILNLNRTKHYNSLRFYSYETELHLQHAIIKIVCKPLFLYKHF